MSKSKPTPKPDHVDVKKLKLLFLKLRDLYQEQITELVPILDSVRSRNEYDNPTLTDLGFFLREMEELCDDLRKEVKQKKELIGKHLCVNLVRETATVSDEDLPEDALTCRGKYATGRADIAQQHGIPKHGTTEYKLLCSYFGVPHITQDLGIIQFHFTKLGEYCTFLSGIGKNPPPGIGKRYDVERITWVKRRGLVIREEDEKPEEEFDSDDD